jgi:hypothetical protein
LGIAQEVGTVLCCFNQSNKSNLLVINYFNLRIHMKKLIAFAAAMSLVAGAIPAFADTNITVSNNNSATVSNTVNSITVSGANDAIGGPAVNTVDGGNVRHADFNNQAGNGNNTVRGGNGGTVVTGNVVATSDVSNTLNYNRTSVDATPWETTNLRVRNRNTATLSNDIGAASATSGNVADGSTGDNMLSGGNVSHAGSSNTAGNGTNNIGGGNGGNITTGSSASHSTVVNVLNRNITRIRK